MEKICENFQIPMVINLSTTTRFSRNEHWTITTIIADTIDDRDQECWN